MANTISNSFITEWSDDVKHAFQQTKSNLRNAVRVVSNVEGSTYKFHKLGSFVANQRSARNADLTYLEPQHNVATATLADWYAPIPVDKLDLPKIGRNPDMKREYVEAGAASINRRLDLIIVGAMDASNTAISTTAGGLTYNKLLEVLEGLNTSDVAPGDRFFVCSPAAITDAMGIPQLTSADYNNLLAVQNGEIRSSLGFQWIMSNQLTSSDSPATRKCYGFHKSAVGLAVGSDVQTDIDFVAHQALYLVNTSLSAGAVTIEATGVLEMEVTE